MPTREDGMGSSSMTVEKYEEIQVLRLDLLPSPTR